MLTHDAASNVAAPFSAALRLEELSHALDGQRIRINPEPFQLGA